MPCCKSIIPLIVAALRFIENMSFESRKQSLSAMWSPHCGVPHSQMRASETCSLCQHCGDVHAIFGALPQLSLRTIPPQHQTYWQASALWPGNRHQTWRGCSVLSQTITLPKHGGGGGGGDRGSSGGGWV